MKYRNLLDIVGGLAMNESLQCVPMPAGPAQQYEKQIASVLDVIDKNPVGNILLGMIARERKQLFINVLPRKAAPGEPFPNAAAIPADLLAASAKGKIVLDNFGNPAPMPGSLVDPVTQQMVPKFEKGTGTGSSVYVLFSPEQFGKWRSFAGMRADELLFHELVHTIRHVRGRTRTRGIGGSVVYNGKEHALGDFNNIEEFLATMLTNVYVSAAGEGRPLRGAYLIKQTPAGRPVSWNVRPTPGKQTAGALKAGYTQSETTVLEYLGVVTQITVDEPDLTRAVSRIECDYNPLRDYQRLYGARTPGAR